MNVVWGLLLVVVVTALSVTVMLLVRRRAPEGSYFSDGDRASGVFGVLATGVLRAARLHHLPRLHLLRRLPVRGRGGGHDRGPAAPDGPVPPGVHREQLTGELICYARSVAGAEWAALDAGTLGDSINPWGARMFLTIRAADAQTPAEQSAYDRWMDQTSDREQARTARVHAAQGIIPSPLWMALLVICGVIFVYMLFFADSGERAAPRPCSWEVSRSSSAC